MNSVQLGAWGVSNETGSSLFKYTFFLHRPSTTTVTMVLEDSEDSVFELDITVSSDMILLIFWSFVAVYAVDTKDVIRSHEFYLSFKCFFQVVLMVLSVWWHLCCLLSSSFTMCSQGAWMVLWEITGYVQQTFFLMNWGICCNEYINLNHSNKSKLFWSTYSDMFL